MKVLIACDGSEYSLSAVSFAARLVGPAGSPRVKIISVTEPAVGIELESVIISVEELKDPDRPEFQEATRICEAAVDLFKKTAGENDIDITHEVLAGPAAQTIVEHAEKWGADLIVMGSHGRGFWSRVLVGSVSDRVAHHASCSVLIVRNGARP